MRGLTNTEVAWVRLMANPYASLALMDTGESETDLTMQDIEESVSQDETSASAQGQTPSNP